MSRLIYTVLTVKPIIDFPKRKELLLPPLQVLRNGKKRKELTRMVEI
jgi:hypothetical protein